MLLADDHALVRRGFRRLLDDDPAITVVGEASTGTEAIGLARTLRPQVIVMDVAMAGMSGLAAMSAILAERPDSAILMLSMHSEETLVRQAMSAGARGYILKNAVDLDLAAAIKRVAAGETVLDPSVSRPAPLGGPRTRALTPREREVLQFICSGKSNREIAATLELSVNTVSVHRANIMNALGVHNAAELVVYATAERPGQPAVNRRDFLRQCSAGAAALALPGADAWAGQSTPSLGFQLTDVTDAAGLQFRHNSGAYGGKLLPETLGSGCAFIDFDADGWQDILLVNGMDWPGHRREQSTLRLYRNNRNGTFTDVTRAAGLDVDLYGMGVAVGDFNNDGFPDVFVTCVGQNRLFRNTGRGTFVDITRTSGLAGRQAFSTSALWFDYDRDGRLDLFVCNYVKWSVGARRLLQPRRQAEGVLHARGVSR